MGYLRGKALSFMFIASMCSTDLNVIHVSLNELMNGCPIGGGKKTRNVIQCVANIEKKKNSAQCDIYVCVPFLNPLIILLKLNQNSKQVRIIKVIFQWTQYKTEL